MNLNKLKNELSDKEFIQNAFLNKKCMIFYFTLLYFLKNKINKEENIIFVNNYNFDFCNIYPIVYSNFSPYDYDGNIINNAKTFKSNKFSSSYTFTTDLIEINKLFNKNTNIIKELGYSDYNELYYYLLNNFIIVLPKFFNNIKNEDFTINHNATQSLSEHDNWLENYYKIIKYIKEFIKKDEEYFKENLDFILNEINEFEMIYTLKE